MQLTVYVPRTDGDVHPSVKEIPYGAAIVGSRVDHDSDLLLIDWADWVGGSLQSFTNELYLVAERHVDRLPTEFRMLCATRDMVPVGRFFIENGRFDVTDHSTLSQWMGDEQSITVLLEGVRRFDDGLHELLEDPVFGRYLSDMPKGQRIARDLRNISDLELFYEVSRRLHAIRGAMSLDLQARLGN